MTESARYARASARGDARVTPAAVPIRRAHQVVIWPPVEPPQPDPQVANDGNVNDGGELELLLLRLP